MTATTMPTKITQSDKSERHYFEELREHTFAKALADRMEIVIPTSCQLQLDIDRPWPARLPAHISKTNAANIIKEVSQIIIPNGRDAKMISLLYRVTEEFPIVHREAWKSAGGNCHVLLTLDRDLGPTTRIALQSMLGSDPIRELCNLRRVLCGADDPIALFRPAAASAVDVTDPASSPSQLRGPGLSQESEAPSLGKET